MLDGTNRGVYKIRKKKKRSDGEKTEKRRIVIIER